jgi:hypothetical protein
MTPAILATIAHLSARVDAHWGPVRSTTRASAHGDELPRLTSGPLHVEFIAWFSPGRPTRTTTAIRVDLPSGAVHASIDGPATADQVLASWRDQVGWWRDCMAAEGNAAAVEEIGALLADPEAIAAETFTTVSNLG